MISYYLKIGFRNLYKYRKDSLLNLLSLSLGIAMLVLIATYVFNEMSVDDFHMKASHIFKVTYGNSSLTPGPLAELLKNEFPEVEDATHIETRQLFASSPVINIKDNSFEIEHYYSANSSFFNIFDFEAVHGDLKTALNTPFSIILTQKEALRLFKNENPVGEIVTWKDYQNYSFTVRAIVKDLPPKSSIQFNGLISEVSLKKMELNYDSDWGYTVFETYLLIKSNVNSVKLEPKLRAYLDDYYKSNLSTKDCFEDAKKSPISLIPLKKVYFNAIITNDTTNRGNLLLMKILIMVGFIIMMLSIINFVNLSIARASRRTKEIGVQKVFGSNHRNFIFQYLTETSIISSIAFIVGVDIAMLIIHRFGQLVNVSYSLELPIRYLFLLFIPGTIILGIIAGIYPALFMSSQKTVDIFKRKLNQKNKGLSLNYFLLVFQFSVSITLIAVTILMYKQVIFFKNKDLGINTENIVYAKLPYTLMQNKELLRERLKNLPDVENVSFSSTIFGKIEGLNSQEIEGRNLNFASLWVDAEFIDLYNLQLIKGRFFSKELNSDINSTVLLNQAAVKALGVDDPFKIEIRVPGRRVKVIGIVKDFNYKSLHSNIEPMTIAYLPSQGQYVNIKLSEKNISKTLNNITTIWEELAPGFPFGYSFLNSRLKNLYSNDQRMGNVITFFAIIAIIIALLGISSLSIFIGESKVKEIGIRKINGARIWDVLIWLNYRYIKCLVVAFVIACPFSWLIMRSWLSDFAYKTNINWWIFAVSGIVTFLIAIITVIWQSWRFATKNPVQTLKYE